MRKTGLLLATPFLAASLAFAAQPGSGSTPANPSGPHTSPRTAQSSESAGAIQQQTANQVLAENIIGMEVYGIQDNQVAKVDDIVLDKDGKVDGVLLSVGGFLGLGDKLVAVPWQQLEIVQGHNPGDKERIRIAMSEDQLKAAPSFKSREAAEAEQRAEHAKQLQEQHRQQDQQAPKGSSS